MTLKPTAIIVPEKNTGGLHEPGIMVEVHWSGADIDRPNTTNWLLGPKKMDLAKRLKKAVDEGGVFSNPRIVKDMNDKTYVTADGYITGRLLNAELKKRGF